MNNSSPVQGNPVERFSSDIWREKFLNIALRVSSILGLIALVFYLLSSSASLFTLLALLTYGILVLITLWVDLAYTFRAGAFVLILYFAALSSLFSLGIGDAGILFLAFVAMTSLLFSARELIYSAIGIMILSILGVGWINLSLAEWMRSIGILLAVSTIIAIGLYRFQEEFTKTQASARHIL